MKTMKVPEDFCYFPFYQEGQKQISRTSLREGISSYPFYGDILVQSQKWETESLPWQAPEKYVPMLFDAWAKDKRFLMESYNERNKKKARSAMIVHIANFMSALWWTNERMITTVEWKMLKEEVRQHEFSPHNIEDRLPYLLEQPDHYLSFLQLSTLMDEWKKTFSATMIKKKRGR